MDIGILGTGMVAQTIGSKLLSIGHNVMLGSRTPDNPKALEWVKEEGHNAYAGTFAEAAAYGEIVFNCTLGAASLEALTSAGAHNLKGKILIDTSNPIDYSTEITTLTVCNTDSLGEQIQRAFPETKVVKTLNTMNANVMTNPAKLIEYTDVFVSGNDSEAKAIVTGYLRNWFGWKSVIDLGDITTSRGVEMFLIMWFSLRSAVIAKRMNIKLVTS